MKFWGTFQFYYLVLGPIFSLLSFYSWNSKYKRLYDHKSDPSSKKRKKTWTERFIVDRILRKAEVIDTYLSMF